MNTLPSIELYSIGTELLMGQIQDTNTYWMAQQIARLGGYVRRIAILDDIKEDIIRTLKDAIDRDARILITTGGLGPTPDDLTVEAVAELIGEDVVVNDLLVESYMARRNIARREDIRPGLLKMATAPRGSAVHPNPAGVAPCVETRIRNTIIYNLPGPPREVEALFNQTLEPVIAQLYSGNRASVRVAVNLPESEVGPLLHSVMKDHPNTYLKAYVALRKQRDDGQHLPVDIVARADTEPDAKALLDLALGAFKTLVESKGRTIEAFEN